MPIAETIQNFTALDVARCERYRDHTKKRSHRQPRVSGEFFQMLYQV